MISFNKILNNIFLILYPFYPFWAWLSLSRFNLSFDKAVSVILFPVALYLFVRGLKRIPNYLIAFILFTLFHLFSIYKHNLIPNNTNWLFFIFSDKNVFACILLILVENTFILKSVIKKLNVRILFVIALSLIFSLIQIKNPDFFVTNRIDEDSLYLKELRNLSIYSWVNLNTLGITFPFLIAIVLNYYNISKRVMFFFITFCGITVAFLSRARYVMISTLIVLSQVIFAKSNKMFLKAYYVFIFMLVAGLFLTLSEQLGIDIGGIVENRILEENTNFASAKTRILSYYVFLDKFPENPIFGVGPKMQEDALRLLEGRAPTIHIGYLQYLYYYGIVGASIFFISLILILKRAWRVGKRTNFWGSFYGFIAFSFANLTFPYFNYSEMGVVLAVIYLKYYEQSKETKGILN